MKVKSFSSEVGRQSEAFSCSSGLLAQGFENGIVKLFDVKKNTSLIKNFKNLKTKISFVETNDNFLVFGSKWKNNSIRVYDVDKQIIGKYIFTFFY